jgi:cytochrome b involved in lipid metabolism
VNYMWILYISYAIPENSPELTFYSGGEEVLLDVAGQDATEAFEDVGHSVDALAILEGLAVGTLNLSVCYNLLQLPI